MPQMTSCVQNQVLVPAPGSAYTPDCGPNGGQMHKITLAAALTINAPLIKTLTYPSEFSAFPVGMIIQFEFVHDGTANVYAITWNAIFKKAAGAFANTNAANAVDTISYQFDGTNWNEIGRALNVS